MVLLVVLDSLLPNGLISCSGFTSDKIYTSDKRSYIRVLVLTVLESPQTNGRIGCSGYTLGIRVV